MQGYSSFIIPIAMVVQPAIALAQRPASFTEPPLKTVVDMPSLDGAWRSRFYLTAMAGPVWNQFHVTGLNVAIQQVSNTLVPGRGIVVVPGTTRPFFPASTDWKNWDGAIGAIGLGYKLGRWRDREWDMEADLSSSSGGSLVTQGVVLPATALQSAGPLFFQRSFRTGWGYSLRGRVAQSWREMLLYGTAGWTGTHVTVTAHDSSDVPVSPEVAVQDPNVSYVPWSATHSDSHLHSGWTLGFGAQRTLSSRADLAFEYRYSRFNTQDYNFKLTASEAGAALTTGGATTGTASTVIEPATSIVRFSGGQLTARVILKQRWW
jgi:opacity protein-like surface antigen